MCLKMVPNLQVCLKRCWSALLRVFLTLYPTYTSCKVWFSFITHVVKNQQWFLQKSSYRGIFFVVWTIIIKLHSPFHIVMFLLFFLHSWFPYFLLSGLHLHFWQNTTFQFHFLSSSSHQQKYGKTHTHLTLLNSLAFIWCL